MAEVVFHSSGSTGAAKEIVRSEESLQGDARCLVAEFPEVWGGDSGDRIVAASVRPEHMYGALWRVRVPALAGCRVDPGVVISVEELLALAASGRSLVFVTTPSFLEKALAHPDFACLRGKFRAIITSGSLLRRATSFAVRDAVGVCPLEIYGSTETGTVAWRRQEDGENWSMVGGVEGACDGEGRLVVDSPRAMARPFTTGDFVEMVDARHFLLKGRADRRVKVLERYVYLPEVEAKFSAHPYVQEIRVEPCGEGVPRLGALVVLTPEGRSALAREGRNAVLSEFRRTLRGEVESLAFPRRFRFVRMLPVNPQGKTTAAAARAALCAWCREPLVLRWQATAEGLEAELVFTEDQECFQGHFPGLPVLPGVAQLYFLRHFARQVFPDWPEAATYRKLKFQRIVRPGVNVFMKVKRHAPSGFEFEFEIAGGRSASGIVETAS